MSEEIEDIKYRNKHLYLNKDDVDKLFNYIEELEKEKQQVLDDYQDLGKDLANNFISKQVIRDKIKEIEYSCMLLLNNYEKCDTCEKESCSIRGKYLILKELLEGEK